MTTPTGGQPERLASGLARAQALTQVLAAESDAGDGAKRCAACGATTRLRLVAPGWGGVWACPACDPRATATLES